MRHGRAKAARKTLQFFGRTHGYAPPYHVLLDGTFVVATVRFKIPVLDRLRSVLQGEAFHLYVTRSTLSELNKLQKAQALSNKEKSDLLEEAYLWASSNATVLEAEDRSAKPNVVPTNHNSGSNEVIVASAPQSAASEDVGDDEAAGDDPEVPTRRGGAHSGMSAAGREMYRIVTASAVLSGRHSDKASHSKSHGANDPQRKYFFASQDEILLDAIRSAGCAPIIRLAHNSVLLLEQPSRSAQGKAVKDERHKWSAKSAVSEPERELVRLVREAKRPHSAAATTTTSPRDGSQPNSAPSLKPDPYRQRKVKKAKGPNPLSCRKKELSMPTTHDNLSNRQQRKHGANDDSERPTKRRRRRK